jgi:hypothetical protein
MVLEMSYPLLHTVVNKKKIKEKKPIRNKLGDIYLNVLQSRLRNRCSGLNSDLYRANLIPNALCSCCKQKENKRKKTH